MMKHLPLALAALLLVAAGPPQGAPLSLGPTGDASNTTVTVNGSQTPLSTLANGYFAASPALCDTSQWTGAVNGGSAIPIPVCYTTKTSNGITVRVPAVVGIAASSTNDQTHIQYAQQLIQAQTTKGNANQESGLAINFVSNTGGGGAAQTNWNQKVALYVPTLMAPGAANTWAFNPDLVIQSGVGNYPGFVEELDMTNFNQPYPPGGTVAASTFRTFLSSYPVTAMEVASATTPSGAVTATLSGGSTSISAIVGTLLVGELVTGVGIPPYTYIVSTSGSNAVMTSAATVSGTGVTVSYQAFGVYDGWLMQGNNLIRDNTIYDSTSSYTSMKIAGSHAVGLDMTGATLGTAINMSPGQAQCFSSGTVCQSYSNTSHQLLYSTTTGTGLAIADTSGAVANYVYVQPSPTGFGPTIKAVGSDPNVNLNLYGQGSGSVSVQTNFGVTGASSFGGITTFNGRTRLPFATVSAAGTNQATATALTNDLNYVASGTGGVLISNLTGQRQEVFNRSGASLNVYPANNAQIEANGVNAAVVITTGGHATFSCVSSTQCYQAP